MFDMQLWSKEFFQKANQPMSKEISSVFSQMLEEDKKKKINLTPFKKEFLYQLIEKKAALIDLNITDNAKVFLMFISEKILEEMWEQTDKIKCIKIESKKIN